MDTSFDRVIDMLIKQLDLLNAALDKLSDSSRESNNITSKEISNIKMDVQKLSNDMKTLQESPCPRDEGKILEIVNIAALRANAESLAKRPRTRRAIALWIFGVSGGMITLIKAIYEFINYLEI